MRKKRIALLTLSILSLGIISLSPFSYKIKYVPAEAYQNNDKDTYYNGVSASLEGMQLISQLNALNNSKRQRLIAYNSMFSYFKYTDPGTDFGDVTSFYTGRDCLSVTREHVWPYSKLILNDNTGNTRGDNEIEQDLHMIDGEVNEGRGNKFYTYSTGSGWDPGSMGDETYRGEAARIIFYTAIADPRLTIVDKDYDASSNATMGRLSTLLEWNLKYPATNRENVRNEAVENIQGHRNPFIDHPEYACRIWGRTNNDTARICGMDKISQITVTPHERSTRVGRTFTLQLDIFPPEYIGSEVVVWSSSNNAVATVDSNGGVTALKPGNVTITASISSLNLSDSCLLHVLEENGEQVVDDNEDDGGTTIKHIKLCGGNIVFTSLTLSIISLLGIGLILLKNKGGKKDE